MAPQVVYRYFAYALIGASLTCIAWKLKTNDLSFNTLYPKERYRLSYEFDISSLPSKATVKAYLPMTNERQKVSNQDFGGDSLAFHQVSDETGMRGVWTTQEKKEAIFSWSADVEGKFMSFDLEESLPLESAFAPDLTNYLQASEHIQSTHPTIDSLAQSLKEKSLLRTLENNFVFVAAIEESGTGVLTDAVTALRRNRASCNGKSRLFAALCRAQGIPAEVTGGIILENTGKRTSHLWVNVFYQEHRIPFDILNNHFAELPANYLELYTGDEFLMTHTKDIGFDYQFHIERKYGTEEGNAQKGVQLFALLNNSGLPLNALRGLLLLPLVAVVIAIMRNVIGMKTFGIFLPALIALGLTNVHLGWGILAFCIVIAAIALLHYPLEKIGLLHTPKIVIMLTVVVVLLLGICLVSVQNNWAALSMTMFLPVIVVSITAERFAKTLVEEQLPEALKMLAYTSLIAALCYPVLQSNLLLGLFLHLPEMYLILLAFMVLLGRWIGMRVLEYQRFQLLVHCQG